MRTASEGRCTPFSRRRPKVAAAIVAPVEPRLTIAAALPAATSAAARTIEDSLRSRTAWTASSLPIHSVVGITSIPGTPSSPSERCGPKTRTPIPSAAARRAPSARTSKPCSAP